MPIWSPEIKELSQIYQTVKGKLPQLEKELGKLVSANDENMLLIYSRRCLEVVITKLCEQELKRHRGTEPLQRIIDKLNKEEVVPHNIVVSMYGVNSMSTFGAHPKEFELRQVKPVLSNLTTIIEWYILYRNISRSVPATQSDHFNLPARKFQIKVGSKRNIVVTGIFVLTTAVIALLDLFDIVNFGFTLKPKVIDSMVILPFDDHTGDNSIDFMINGMHSMLITQMQYLSKLQVTDKTSSRAFQEAGLTLKGITSELDVKAALVTDVYSFGEDTIDIQMKLFRTTRKVKEIWNKEYKVARGENDKYNKQLTKDVAERLNLNLSLREQNFLAEWKNVNPEAEKYYLEGLYYLDQIEKETLQEAIDCFKNAINIESDWAAPYIGLSSVGSYQSQMHYALPQQALNLIRPNLEKALELAPNSALVHYHNAGIAVWTDWDWEKGLQEFEKSLELNPNDALCRMFYAHLLMILKRQDEAIEQANLALKRDPMRPFILGLYGVVMRHSKRYIIAIEQTRKALEINPNHYFSIRSLRNTYRHMGEWEKWFEIWKEMTSFDRLTVDLIDSVFYEQGYAAAFGEIIKVKEKLYNGGVPISQMALGNDYLLLGNYDKAMDCFERSYNKRDPNLPYFSLFSLKSRELVENERYKALMNKMKLPLE